MKRYVDFTVLAVVGLVLIFGIAGNLPSLATNLSAPHDAMHVEAATKIVLGMLWNVVMVPLVWWYARRSNRSTWIWAPFALLINPLWIVVFIALLNWDARRRESRKMAKSILPHDPEIFARE